MPLEKFKERRSENVPGAFYVDSQCLDCDLCRELAPTIFARQSEGGYSYIKKQPENSQELAKAKEALDSCCTEAISADGMDFDWKTVSPSQPGQYGAAVIAKKRWWEFWKA